MPELWSLCNNSGQIGIITFSGLLAKAKKNFKITFKWKQIICLTVGRDWNQSLGMKWINKIKNKSLNDFIWDQLGTKMNILQSYQILSKLRRDSTLKQKHCFCLAFSVWNVWKIFRIIIYPARVLCPVFHSLTYTHTDCCFQPIFCLNPKDVVLIANIHHLCKYTS